jgi:hypothetical protein
MCKWLGLLTHNALTHPELNEIITELDFQPQIHELN